VNVHRLGVDMITNNHYSPCTVRAKILCVRFSFAGCMPKRHRRSAHFVRALESGGCVCSFILPLFTVSAPVGRRRPSLRGTPYNLRPVRLHLPSQITKCLLELRGTPLGITLTSRNMQWRFCRIWHQLNAWLPRILGPSPPLS